MVATTLCRPEGPRQQEGAARRAVMTEAVALNVAKATRVNWGAVLCGWTVAHCVAALLHVVGLALGGSSAGPVANAAPIGQWSSVWMVFSWAAALSVGSFLASWLGGNMDRAVGAMHGITVWALTTLVAVVVVTAAHDQLRSARPLVPGAMILESAAVGAPWTLNADERRASIALQAELQRRAIAAADRAAAAASMGHPQRLGQIPLAAAADALLNGHAEEARDLLIADGTLREAEVARVLGDARPLVQQYQDQLRRAEARTARRNAAGMWLVLVGSLVGLFSAVLGGWLGHGGAARMYLYRFR